MLLSISFGAHACDVCGCSISGLQFGILPQFQKHFLGVRYGTKSFQTLHSPVFSADKLTTSNELFQNLDLWGRIVLSERIQMFGFIPYNSIVKRENGEIFNQNGLGDISLIAMYAIINQRKSSSLAVIQNLQVGGGIKLPSGSHDVITSDGSYVPGVQLGSGSVDILANLNYIIKYKDSGLSIESSYRYNQTNSLDFKFGNRLTNTAKLFYKIDLAKVVLMPNMGFSIEKSFQDNHEGLNLDLSGGEGYYGQVGIDIFTTRVTIGVQFQPIIHENIADGNITSNTRLTVQSMYIF
ncbi:MAG TPA: hypothetical protein PJ990_02305 [Saprospiraceae bacterium]|nr:hypothetical protein [Saprospiraceae bacterium]